MKSRRLTLEENPSQTHPDGEWLYRVKLPSGPVITAYLGSFGVNVRADGQDANAPCTFTPDEIYLHLQRNRDDDLPREDCIAAIRLIKNAVAFRSWRWDQEFWREGHTRLVIEFRRHQVALDRWGVTIDGRRVARHDVVPGEDHGFAVQPDGAVLFHDQPIAHICPTTGAITRPKETDQ